MTQSTTRRGIAAALFLLAFAPAPAVARQRPPETRRPEPAKPADPAARPQFVAAVKDPIAAAIDGLKWRSIGPANNAGRIPAIAGVPGDPTTYYVGGAAGGIAKTTNGGVTFRQIFDKQSVASIGAIVVAPSDPHIVYVGTGEIGRAHV